MTKFVRGTAIATALAATLGLGFALGDANARQPHMQSALDDLQAAKAQLQAATHNKGGHRTKAIELTNEAIGEVRDGIADGAD